MDTVHVVEVKTWSGMKYAKSFPLENDEGEGGRSHKGYRKKKNTEISVSCVNILIVQ